MNNVQIIFLIIIVLMIGTSVTLIVFKDKIWSSDNKYYDDDWESSLTDRELIIEGFWIHQPK